MPSTFTPNLLLEKQATGENPNTWGEVLDAVLDRLDRVIAQTATFTLTSADVLLTDTQALAARLEAIGTLTANVNVIVPARQKSWIVKNSTSGAFTVTFKTASGTGITVSQGATGILYCDGANMLQIAGGGNSQALNNLAGAADQLPYFTGAAAMALTTLTAAARAILADPTLVISALAKTLLDDTDAATARATLGAAPDVVRGCLVGNATDQGASSGLNYIPFFNTEIYDTDGIHSGSSTTLVVPTGVTWVRVSANILWESATDGIRVASLLKNGSNFSGEPFVTMNQIVGGLSAIYISSPPLQVVAGDFFQVLTQHTNSTGDINIEGNPSLTWFAMEILK